MILFVSRAILESKSNQVTLVRYRERERPGAGGESASTGARSLPLPVPYRRVCQCCLARFRSDFKSVYGKDCLTTGDTDSPWFFLLTPRPESCYSPWSRVDASPNESSFTLMRSMTPR